MQSRLYADYGRIRAKEEPAAGATSPGATGPQSPPGSGGGLGGAAPPQRPQFPPASGPGLGAMQHTVGAPAALCTLQLSGLPQAPVQCSGQGPVMGQSQLNHVSHNAN